MKPELSWVGYYVCGLGGAASPFQIEEGSVCFELITHGAVYDFEDEPKLHGAGAVFFHQSGDFTVSKAREDEHYRCFIAKFNLENESRIMDWPRWFHWPDIKNLRRFSDEMLFASHKQETPVFRILRRNSSPILSQFC